MRPCQLVCSMTTSMQDKAFRILKLICTKCLQKQKNKELEARVEALLNERDVLKGRVQQLKVSPCSDVIALHIFRCSSSPYLSHFTCSIQCLSQVRRQSMPAMLCRLHARSFMRLSAQYRQKHWPQIVHQRCGWHMPWRRRQPLQPQQPQQQLLQRQHARSQCRNSGRHLQRPGLRLLAHEASQLLADNTGSLRTMYQSRGLESTNSCRLAWPGAWSK